MTEKVTVFNIADLEKFNTVEGLVTLFFVNDHVSIAHITLPPNIDAPVHAHKRTAVLFGLKGNTTLVSNDGHFHLSKGDVAVIQPEVAKGFRNETSSDAEIVISSPSGFKTLESMMDVFRSLSQGSK
jgi:quercetin dioxygenase-like cupin family protein